AKITAGGATATTKSEASVGVSQANNDPHIVPSARKAFNASGLDTADNIEGTGKKGRITSEDVKYAVASVNKPQQQTV
ncbi:E3 binding domain-containing protein, partial [Francisella tularensis subsp. holarctica]|uniref:E3 binding domain-containing protein n=1 Tax=Francisella tularensis TaxID=263 RepID=UPI0023819533